MNTVRTTAPRKGLRFAAAFAIPVESPRCTMSITASMSETWFITTMAPRSAFSAARSSAAHSTRKRCVTRARKTKSRKHALTAARTSFFGHIGIGRSNANGSAKSP